MSATSQQTRTNLPHLIDSYASLPELFYQLIAPEQVDKPEVVLFNAPLAAALGDAWLHMDAQTQAEVLSGQRLLPGAQPKALAYAGHQFGYFNKLGDGRAHLLGSIRTEQSSPWKGALVDLQLKGSGPTRFSRNGDGRASIGPMLREYLVSEAMHALGIPTTRALAVVTTGASVYRQRLEPGALMVRVAQSHLRVGTFELTRLHEGVQNVEDLLHFTLQRHYPELATSHNPALTLLEGVMRRQVTLILEWMRVGFIHGVMNTDNMALSGETIDYGPCAFMDEYHPHKVFSSIDTQGRYAFANQAPIAQWNLARFAETLLPLIHPDSEQAVAMASKILGDFALEYERGYRAMMCRKLGILAPEDQDDELIKTLLEWMQQSSADYTLTFQQLTQSLTDRQARPDQPGLSAWYERWQQRLQAQANTLEEAQSLMQRHNPVVIPRNHQVEKALVAAEQGDFQPTKALLQVIQNPYRYSPAAEAYLAPPKAHEKVMQTFCGT